MKSRELNEQENVAIDRAIERCPSLRDYLRLRLSFVEYQQQENFTLCLLLNSGCPLVMGASKRNPTDRENRRQGEALAFRAALDNLGRRLAEQANGTKGLLVEVEAPPKSLWSVTVEDYLAKADATKKAKLPRAKQVKRKTAPKKRKAAK